MRPAAATRALAGGAVAARPQVEVIGAIARQPRERGIAGAGARRRVHGVEDFADAGIGAVDEAGEGGVGVFHAGIHAGSLMLRIERLTHSVRARGSGHPVLWRQCSEAKPGSPRPRGERENYAAAVSFSGGAHSHAGKLHRSRRANAPEVCHRRPGLPGIRHSKHPRPKARGTARRGARPILWHTELLAPRGASRRAVAASCTAPGRASGVGSSACRRFTGGRPSPAPISELLAAGHSARGRSPGAARKRWPAKPSPAGAGPNPRAGATGSCPFAGIGRKGIWS